MKNTFIKFSIAMFVVISLFALTACGGGGGGSSSSSNGGNSGGENTPEIQAVLTSQAVVAIKNIIGDLFAANLRLNTARTSIDVPEDLNEKATGVGLLNLCKIEFPKDSKNYIHEQKSKLLSKFQTNFPNATTKKITDGNMATATNGEFKVALAHQDSGNTTRTTIIASKVAGQTAVGACYIFNGKDYTTFMFKTNFNCSEIEGRTFQYDQYEYKYNSYVELFNLASIMSNENSTTYTYIDEKNNIVKEYNYDGKEVKKESEPKPDNPVSEIDNGLSFSLPDGASLDIISCPEGVFYMGSLKEELGRSDNEEFHQVKITKSFYIGKYEVTQAQYKALMGKYPSEYSQDTSKPVYTVSYEDAKAFCNLLNTRFANSIPNGYTFDLPTEAQWEYACRAGTTTSLNSGKDITTAADAECPNLNEVGWYAKNSDSTAHPVGQKKPNKWGIYDMHGNVEEWVRDWYADDYDNGDQGEVGYLWNDPTGPKTGELRVVKGGGYYSLPDACRSARRFGLPPTVNDNKFLGFRVALVPIQ